MRVIQKDLTIFKDEYHKNGCVKLPSFLNPLIVHLLNTGFSGKVEKRELLNGASNEFTVSNDFLITKLDVAFNDPEFISGMSGLIGRDIRFAKLRLSFIDPSCTSLPWHDDSYEKDTRVAAVRFELSDSLYEGGDFLYRSDAGEFRFSGLKFGESVIFKIDYGRADHMVTPVTAGVRKSLTMFLCE